MKQFFSTFKKTWYNPIWYKGQVKQTPAGKAFGFFVVTLSLFTGLLVLIGVITSIVFAPTIKNMAAAVIDNHVPQDYEITLHDDYTLEHNQALPLRISLPNQQTRDEVSEEAGRVIDFVMVVDPSKEFTGIEDFSNERAFVVLYKDVVVAATDSQTSAGSLEIRTYEEVGELGTATYTDIVEMVQSAAGWILPLVVLIVGIFIFIGTLIVITMPVLILGSSISIFKKDWSFKQAMAAMWYMAVPALCIGIVFTFLTGRPQYLLILLGLSLANVVLKDKNTPETEVVS